MKKEIATPKKNIVVSSLIFLSIFVAFLPVILSSNYLRQDDLMWAIWPGMKVSDFGFIYYNTVYQLVRPLCMLSFYITDLVSISIHHAVYVRLLNIITLGIMGIMLYRWQLIFNTNRILAATFAICAFTLPPFQLFAATQNYFLILTALLMTLAAMFFWHAAYYEKTDKKRRYFWLANLLLFASFMEYPLSSMFVWVMLSMYYLNILAAPDFKEKRRFFYYVGFTTVALMVAYYIFIMVFHKIFHVDLSYRPAVVNTHHIFQRFLGIFDVMSWHSNMWLWVNTNGWFSSPIGPICILFTIALIQSNLKKGLHDSRLIFKNVVSTFAITFGLFFMAYSPVMATPDVQVTFRYAIATMPMLLYIAFWSLNEIASPAGKSFLASLSKVICSLVFISITIFGIAYANLMIGDGIVGPHEHDFAYMQQQLTEKALPLLKQHKPIVLHVIDCDNGKNYHYPAGVPTALEYSMRTCAFQQQALSVAIHSLSLFGYPSNYRRQNTIIWNTNEIIVRDIPWGDLIVNSVADPHLAQLKYPENETPTVVTIDLRDEPVYQHMEFYKNLLGIKS